MYALEGGSVGFQIGGEATDLILLVMNDRGMESILSSKVKLGADASIAGRPQRTRCFRRHRRLDASRDSELFAIARRCLPAFRLKAPTLRPDDDASADVYGHAIKAKDIVRGDKMASRDWPSSGQRLAEEVLRATNPSGLPISS